MADSAHDALMEKVYAAEVRAKANQLAKRAEAQAVWHESCAAAEREFAQEFAAAVTALIFKGVSNQDDAPASEPQLAAAENKRLQEQLEAARDWYRDHRSSSGGIYDENTWGDPFERASSPAKRPS
jgi:hypothetical protein